MDEIKYKERVMKNAIKTINENNTFLNKCFNFFKYILCLIGIRNLWCKRFIFDTVKVRYNESNYVCPCAIELVIKDDCLLMNGFIVPYEYLISLKRLSVENYNLYIFDVLGKITPQEDRLKINLGGEHLKFLFYTDDNYNIIKTITKNMFYHLVYNKINDQVILDINKKNN
jgi:hypothetical protein